MSIESDLLVAVATYLDAQGVAEYKLTGYLPTDTAIVFGPLQTDPDRMVALTIYDSTDYVRQPISEYRIQFFMRGRPGMSTDAGDLASDIFDALQGLQDQQWGDLYLTQCKRLVVSGQDTDANLRAERADSYIFTVNTPATTRRF